MNRKTLLSLMLLAFAFFGVARAQVTIGDLETATNDSYLPMNSLYEYSYSQQIYTADEIGMAGTINSITVWMYGNANLYEMPFDIYMLEVDKETFESTSDWVAVTTGDIVYSGSVTVHNTDAEAYTFDLDTPFQYSGQGNLLIAFDNNTGQWKSGLNGKVFTIEGDSSPRAIYARRDSNDYDPTNMSGITANSVTPKRNVVEIDITPSGTGPTCEKPSTFEVSEVTAYGATFHWESEVGNYAFEIKKASETDWNVYSLADNTLVLTSLEPFTVYNARVKAVCDAGLESGYKTASFTTLDACPEGMVCIGEGTATSSYLPTYNYYNYSLTEQIYTASEIGEAALIESVDIYSVGSVTRNLEFYMVSTEKTVFDTVTDWIPVAESDMVFSGSVTFAATSWNTIEFDAPFFFDGVNNVVLVVRDITGSYVSSINFFVFNTDGKQAIRAYRDSPGAYDPSAPGVNGTLMNVKNRVRFGVSAVPSCWKPTGFAVNNVFGHSAELSWNSDADAWQICVNGDEANLIDVTENPYTLDGLDPETDYTVKVRTNCGSDGYSQWTSELSFTTDVACPAPTNMTFADITAYTATIGWTSESENFEMQYTINGSGGGLFSTDFDNSSFGSWTTIDADGDGYDWVLGSEAGGIYLAEGGSLAGSGHNSSADMAVSGSYSNAIGDALTPDNYLVSPQITLGGSISFWACAQDVSYCAEHFGVAVSTTSNTNPEAFTTIQEWTISAKSAGSLKSSNAPRGGNRDQGTWALYTVDLSAYSGEGYVAIRHFDCSDEFMLDVDDITIEQPGEVEWITINNISNPYTLTGLEPETNYQVRVRANCGEEGYSAWLRDSFTTLPSCLVPTGLTVTNIDKRSADLAWVATGDEGAWQIFLSDGTDEQIIDVTDTIYSFTGLTPETTYTVKVRAYCDLDDQSAWSRPANFTTLVACPAPTGLAISNIANVSAVASWTYEGDVELQYAEDVWMHYDNGVFASSVGTGGSDVYWAIMLPPTMLGDEPLTKVAVYETAANNTEPLTIMIYSGGTTAPDTTSLLYQEVVTTVAANDFHEITLAQAVDFDATQNLWIVCKEYGTYPATGGANTGNPNGRWISLDGEEWADVTNYSLYYTWMIRAAFGNAHTEWITVDNAASPQTITGLTPETNYMVRVRAICGGEDGESVWVTTNFTTDVACAAPTALVATPYALSAMLSWQGVSESYNVKYGYDEVASTLYSEDFTDGIPASWVNDTTYAWTVVDGYIQSSNAGVGGSTSTISFTTTLSTNANIDFDAQCMGEGTSTAWDKCIFSIDGTVMFTKGANGEQWDHYSFPVTAGEHTFTWSYSKDSSVNPPGDYFAVANVAIVEVSRVWNTTTATTNECLLTGLTPLTTYYAQVQGDCGDVFGLSEWSQIISFSTNGDVCPVPTALAVDTITANIAGLSWNGSPDVESFTVRYRVPEHIIGGISEEFGTSIPTGWTKYTGLLGGVLADTIDLQSTISGWYFGTNNGVFDNHARINIYGSGCKYWLVSPTVELASSTASALTFDLALTKYSGTLVPVVDTLQQDDKFVVLITTDNGATWSILREWNNTGSEYVYNNIVCSETGESVTIDLSNYAGQSIAIAFYGESLNPSTMSNTGGDNNLHIDNVSIGNPETVPATEWEMVSSETTSVMLTDLTPETTYEAQVKSDCSEPEAWSNAITFTTLEGQSIITQVVDFAEGWNWWSAYVESEDLLGQLEEGLEGNGQVIKSQISFVNYDENSGWMGPLNEEGINNESSYHVKTVDDSDLEIFGFGARPADHPITLHTGWTWVGYPSTATVSVTDAMVNLEPAEGDVLKSQESYATYYSDLGWIGSLKTLEPGMGLLYKSENDDIVTFTYGNGLRSVETEENITTKGNRWEPNVRAYRDNMSVMAVVELDDAELTSENYEIAAFANGVCRGSAKLMFVEALNRYFAFLTVYGEETAELSFGLYDAETGMTTFASSESLNFDANAVVGNPMEPCVVHFRGTTGIDDIDANLHIFPNPVEKGNTFSIDLPVSGKVLVEVVNTLGEVVDRVQAPAGQMMKAPAVAGVYTLRITVDGNRTYIRKLVVR